MARRKGAADEQGNQTTRSGDAVDRSFECKGMGSHNRGRWMKEMLDE